MKEEIKNEEWKDIANYEGLYMVSNHGRIKALYKRIDTGKCHREWLEHFNKFGIDKKGYVRVSLSKNGKTKTFKVHRLVAEAFIPNPDGLPQVNHIDGNKQNNHVDNLEWCTPSENLKHASRTGLLKDVTGANNPSHKLSESDVNYIRKVYQARHKEYGTVALAKRFKVHRKTISRIVCSVTWKVEQ